MNPLVSSSTALQTHRLAFPALGNKTYFNYGGQGPLPTPALAAMQEAYAYLQQEGPFSRRAIDWFTQDVELTRAAIAAELGVAPETITLTEAVSVGCNIALWGLDWQAGDHLLLTDCEHPGIVAAAGQLSRRFGVEVSTCPLMSTLNAGDPIAVITDYLRPNTRLVVVSHILWNTGQVLPLKEIVAACRSHSPRQRPLSILVDAAQSVGVLPLNLGDLDADFYAFTGHKWWCGPEGLGGLYVRPESLEMLQPTFIGWRGITSNPQGQPTGWKPDGRRFEIATSAFPLCAGLRASLELHRHWGTAEERYQRICTLSRKLWELLQALPNLKCLRTAPPAAGLVSFQLTSGSHRQLVDFLEARDMMIRLILDPNCVRACVHYLTLEPELNQLVDAVAAFS